MRYSFVRKDFPGGNPVANALVVVVGTLVVGVAVVLGFFAFVALAALVLLSAGVIGIRLWWLQRKFSRYEPGRRRHNPSKRHPGGVIEGDYRVIREDRDAP